MTLNIDQVDFQKIFKSTIYLRMHVGWIIQKNYHVKKNYNDFFLDYYRWSC